MYLSGKGVNKDYEEAAYWFARSAEQGNAVAQFRLGYMYLAGVGVTKNIAKAYAWFSIAAQNNVKEAQIQLKSISGRITSSELEEAKRYIQEINSKLKPQS